MAARTQIGINGVLNFLESLFEGDVHAMRVYSMANAMLATIQN